MPYAPSARQLHEGGIGHARGGSTWPAQLNANDSHFARDSIDRSTAAGPGTRQLGHRKDELLRIRRTAVAVVGICSASLLSRFPKQEQPGLPGSENLSGLRDLPRLLLYRVLSGIWNSTDLACDLLGQLNHPLASAMPASITGPQPARQACRSSFLRAALQKRPALARGRRPCPRAAVLCLARPTAPCRA